MDEKIFLKSKKTKIFCFLTKNLSPKTTSDQVGFTSEFYTKYKGEIISILDKFFNKIE